MIQLQKALAVCSVVCLFLVSRGGGSGLPNADIAQLLDKDWSVIEKIASANLAQSSAQSASGAGHFEAEPVLQRVIKSFHSTPHVGAISLHPPASEAIPPEPSTHEQQMPRRQTRPGILRVGVPAPTSIRPIDLMSRRLELARLSVAIRDLNYNIVKKRKVLPLIVDNLPAQTYKTYYKHYLSPAGKPSFHWTHSGATYLFSKPTRRRTMFGTLFGSSDIGTEEFWAAWKLHKRGKARIWRLLGAIEMPSYRTTDKLMVEHMTQVPPPPFIPMANRGEI